MKPPANSIKQSTLGKKEEGEGDREDPPKSESEEQNPKWVTMGGIESNHGLNLFTQA